jgi:hypothetical protein
MKPSIEYLLNSLNGTQKDLVSLFTKFKSSDENLYLGLVDPVHLHFTRIEKLSKDIENYFSKEFDVENHTKPYSFDFRNFVKLCWLTDVYLTEGIRNPLGVHYNPRIDKNVIHPGSIRESVYNLFHTGPINVIYFNTNGVQFPWMEEMQIVELSEIDCYVSIVPDHGSLIPHLNYEPHLIEDNVPVYHNRIRQRFSKDFTIRSNVSINALQRWETSLTPTVELTFKDNYDIKDVVRAVILVSLGYEYSSDNFKIKHL